MSRSTVYSTLKKLTNDRNESVYKTVKTKSGVHYRVFTPQNVSKLKKWYMEKLACHKEKLAIHLAYHNKEYLICLKKAEFIIQD